MRNIKQIQQKTGRTESDYKNATTRAINLFQPH